MKLTPWFPGTIKPVRKGVYQQKNGTSGIGYQRWDGKFWYAWRKSPEDAKNCLIVVSTYFQNDSWRGVAK